MPLDSYQERIGGYVKHRLLAQARDSADAMAVRALVHAELEDIGLGGLVRAGRWVPCRPGVDNKRSALSVNRNKTTGKLAQAELELVQNILRLEFHQKDKGRNLRCAGLIDVKCKYRGDESFMTWQRQNSRSHR